MLVQASKQHRQGFIKAYRRHPLRTKTLRLISRDFYLRVLEAHEAGHDGEDALQHTGNKPVHLGRDGSPTEGPPQHDY